MSDPLSITASIAGLISVADLILQRSIQFRKYCKAAKSSQNDIQDLTTQVGLLAGTFEQLRKLILFLGDKSADNCLVPELLKACYRTLNKIEEKLKISEEKTNSSSRATRLIEKAKWPFSSDEIAQLLLELSRHQANVQLALSADSMSGILQSLSQYSHLQKELTRTSENVDRILEICVRVELDTKRNDTIAFFMKINPNQYFQRSLSLRHPNTGIWLRRNDEFQQWLSMQHPLLWLSGKVGAGKTVLAGMIIEDALQASSESTAVAYFYCDYQNEQSRNSEGILGALLAQIALQKTEAFDVLQQYYDELQGSGSLAGVTTTDKLLSTLQDMGALFDQVFLVVDGIDECEELTGNVLPTLLKLATFDKTSLAVFSRDLQVIREIIGTDVPEITISATNDDVTQYVQDEIESRISSRRLRNIGPTMKEEIVTDLVEGAEGM